MMRIPVAVMLLALFLPAGPLAQALTPTQDEVLAGAARLYHDRVGKLAQARMLDRDAVFLDRVKRIVQRLAEHARTDDPATRSLTWEVHTSDDADDNASCMAGGKLLISQPFVERLALTDAELAMVLSHEMQHALLRHNLKEYEEALRLDPIWRGKPFAALEDAVDHDSRLMDKLSAINLEQEVEADREGMIMAWRAGWPAVALAGYFRKMEQASSDSRRKTPTHQSPLQRWRTARGLARSLDGNHPRPPIPRGHDDSARAD